MTRVVRVTRIEADVNGLDAAFILTILRDEAGNLVDAAPAEDLPQEVRNALIAWAAGDQP